jgi:predicted dehydrogenase
MSQHLAIIGAGNIAPFHVEAALNAGFKITSIAASENSQSALQLSRKFQIPKYYPSVEELLSENNFDCLSIMIPPAATEKILAKVALLDKPTIIEKPVASSSNFLENFIDNKNVFVGFNRRFYRTISELKSESSKNKGIYSFEAVESLNSKKSVYLSIQNAIMNNTVHIIDLIKYLVGNYELKDYIYSQTNHTLIARIFVKNEYIGDLKISFESKKNTKIEFESSNLNLILKPLEILQKYNDLQISDPTTDTPVRIYLPNWNDKKIPGVVYEPGPFKPGFADQYLEFINFCEKNIMPIRLATLKDAQYTIQKCERLMEQYGRNLNYGN